MGNQCQGIENTQQYLAGANCVNKCINEGSISDRLEVRDDPEENISNNSIQVSPSKTQLRPSESATGAKPKQRHHKQPTQAGFQGDSMDRMTLLNSKLYLTQKDLSNLKIENVEVQSQYSEFIQKTIRSCLPNSKRLDAETDNDKFSMREPSG